MSIVAFIIGIVALVATVGFGMWQTIFNRKVEQQLLGSGTTLLEVRWTWLDDQVTVLCSVQAKQIPISDVKVGFGRQMKSIGDFRAGEPKEANFTSVTIGEKWVVSFLDPNKRRHKESCLVWGNESLLCG